MKRMTHGGGWPAIRYTFKKAREAKGVFRMFRALRTKNTCKTCALGMGGQRGGMVNETGSPFELCKKSVQAMAADMQGGIPAGFFEDVSLEQLQQYSSRELEGAGRLTEPVYAGPLDQRYRTISWEEAIGKVVEKLQNTAPEESFFYFSGRSSNEAAFLLQLFARMYGTNHVNNCSYYCHQASGVGLSTVTGSGTATVTLEDLDQCDLVFVIGANPASNHPRFMKSLVEVRRRGGHVIIINPLREVGLERFKIPSDWRSMLRASEVASHYVQPNIGGDIALLTGILKALLEQDAIDHRFTADHTEGWQQVEEHVNALTWEGIEKSSGLSRKEIKQVADIYANSKNTIFAWAMGITHHEHGVGNVQMIANLAIARGMLGAFGKGLLPLRGHSNVQGIGSMGVSPKLKDAIFHNLQEYLGVQLPTFVGLDTMGCMERAGEGAMRFALMLGGNLWGSNPDQAFAKTALGKIDQVVYLSTTLNLGHVNGRGKETLILPVLARDEEAQSTTQESMFNFVRLSDGGSQRHEGPRSEVDVIAEMSERYFGEDPLIDFSKFHAHRNIREAIAQVVPGYEKIGAIDEAKEEFHVKGRTFHEPHFATETGKARCHVVEIPVGRGADTMGDRGLRLMTIRSEGQFNTVVYENEDIYRGQERRDVIMMNEADIKRMGLREDQRVTVRSETGALKGLLVRTFDIPPGNASTYYPEANVLIARHVDPQSKTPAFKNIPVTIEV
jgi:molybdopterin-dependent oxidoreductase alpha subunit